MIRITGENITLSPEDGSRNGIAPGEYVRLSVSDTGAGMSPAVLQRVFEPFFTTKPDGHGTGLGLSMVFGFVKQSGGHVQISSEPGQGTLVQMYFPHSLEPESQEAPDQVEQQEGGRETILVVEDNEGVRGAAVELLQQAGYTVLTATDGDDAMLMLRTGLRPDLIFTDVVMPGRIKVPTWPPGPRRNSRPLQYCSPPGIPVTFFPATTCWATTFICWASPTAPRNWRDRYARY